MSEGPFRDELAAAHARIAQLEAERDAGRGGSAPSARRLELEGKRKALVDEMPKRILRHRVLLLFVFLLFGFAVPIGAGEWTMGVFLGLPVLLLITVPGLIFGPRRVRKAFGDAIAKLDVERDEARRMEQLAREVSELRAEQPVRVGTSPSTTETDSVETEEPDPATRAARQG